MIMKLVVAIRLMLMIEKLIETKKANLEKKLIKNSQVKKFGTVEKL